VALRSRISLCQVQAGGAVGGIRLDCAHEKALSIERIVEQEQRLAISRVQPESAGLS